MYYQQSTFSRTPRDAAGTIHSHPDSPVWYLLQTVTLEPTAPQQQFVQGSHYFKGISNRTFSNYWVHQVKCLVRTFQEQYLPVLGNFSLTASVHRQYLKLINCLEGQKKVFHIITIRERLTFKKKKKKRLSSGKKT